MQYQLAIFDLDGTLLDTLGDLRASLNAALAAYSLPPHTLEEVRAIVGSGIRSLTECGAPAGTPQEILDGIFDAFNRHYAAHCMDCTQPYSGIPELLRTLRARGVKCAVVSNKSDYGVQMLCERFFPAQFDFVLGLRDGLRKKPAPDAVDAALTALGIPRAQAVYVGDSEVDVATAQNAGMACISVDWGFRSHAQLVAAGASHIVSTPQALLQAILRADCAAADTSGGY